MCLKKFIENYHSPWKLILSHHFNIKITGINSFFIVIMMLLTYLNPFQTFIASVLKLGLQSPRNNQPCVTGVIEQILWNNKHIRIDDKPQFYKKSFMAGISRIKDIFLTNGKLKPWNFFSEKGLNLNNYLLILGLSKALPESWRALLNSGATYCSQIPHSDSTDFTELIFHLKSGDINLIKLTSKKLYWILVEDIYLIRRFVV